MYPRIPWEPRPVPMGSVEQWRTEGGWGVQTPPPPRNSEDIGGVLDRISKKNLSKKNRRLDFIL